MPGHVIEAALRTAPPSYILGARDPEWDLPLDGRHVHLATDGCGIEVLDPWTLEVRRSTLGDVADIARVADALDAIAFHWVAVSAQDRPPATRVRSKRSRPSGGTPPSTPRARAWSRGEDAATGIEMASAIAGGRAALRERPVFSMMQCTISPLAHDGGSIDAGLVAAEAGVPVGYMTMASCAFSGPATIAGSLIVGNAEVISALALMQLAYPGCPVYYAAAQTAMDLRSGAYTGGGPEDFLFGAATNELSDFYDVPLSMGAYATGAKRSDWQAGLENGLSSFMASVVGSDMLLGAGLLHGSRIWSYEQMILDTEIDGIVKAMLRGIPDDDVALALEAIAEVGPGGEYLTLPHTRTHMRGLWQARYLDRRPYGQWAADPEKPHREALERARDAPARPSAGAPGPRAGRRARQAHRRPCATSAGGPRASADAPSRPSAPPATEAHPPCDPVSSSSTPALIERIVGEALALLARPGVKVEEPEAISVLVAAAPPRTATAC